MTMSDTYRDGALLDSSPAFLSLQVLRLCLDHTLRHSHWMLIDSQHISQVLTESVINEINLKVNINREVSSPSSSLLSSSSRQVSQSRHQSVCAIGSSKSRSQSSRVFLLCNTRFGNFLFHKFFLFSKIPKQVINQDWPPIKTDPV